MLLYTTLKPCAMCMEKYGKPGCSHSGCCVFEDVPGKSPTEILNSLS